MRGRTVLLALALTAACAPNPDTPGRTDPTADSLAIVKVRETWAAAWRAQDAAGIGALYAANGHELRDDTPTVDGPEGMQRLMADAFAKVTPDSIRHFSEQLQVSGDLATDRGRFVSTLTPKTPGAAAKTDSGRYLVVLTRVGAEWKMLAGMTNRAVPTPGIPDATAEGRRPGGPEPR